MKCKCGCGNDSNTKSGWKHGHWNKVNPGFAGRTHSEASKKKMSDAHVGRGKPHTEDSKRKISEFLTGRKRPEISGSNHRNWEKDREALVTRQKMYKRMRRMIHRMREQLELKRPWRTYEIGYSPVELKEHLEKLWKPGMNWGNYGCGHGNWQIDHIKPVSSFPLDSNMSEVNALSNLQPLWYEENMSKFNKLGENKCTSSS